MVKDALLKLMKLVTISLMTVEDNSKYIFLGWIVLLIALLYILIIRQTKKGQEIKHFNIYSGDITFFRSRKEKRKRPPFKGSHLHKP